MLSGSFQEHIPYDLTLTYLCLPLGLMALYGGFIKNVVGQLQFSQSWLQAIRHFAYTSVTTIKWAGYGSWLSQPEGVREFLEAYLENWLVLSALMEDS